MKLLTSPILWACLNALGAAFVANAPNDMPYLWVGKFVAATFAAVAPLQERAEVLREWIKPKSRNLLST